jgi:tRNA nucleotidyltransferase (CCA-adding enzyme)
VDRERAIDLAEHLLRNLDDGQETWPLSLVTAVYVSGSFARGALTPGDLDIDIEKTSDEQWSTHFVRSLSAGGDPFIPLRKALATGRRGY